MKNYILSIETSSNACSVALHKKNILIATSACHIAKAHNKVLLKMVRDTLTLAETATSHLQAIAVSHGPGSYTGLRIGISTAKGLAYGLSIPLIAINTLEILAHGALEATGHERNIAALLDARQGRAYTMVLSNSGKIMNQAAIYKVNLKDLPIQATAQSPFFLVGSGAEEYATHLQGDPNIKIIKGKHPQAAEMGTLAYEKWMAHDWEDLAYVTPFYLNQ